MTDADGAQGSNQDVHQDKARHDEGQASTRRYVTTPDGRTVPAESVPVPEHGDEATSGGSGPDDQQQGNPPEAITEGDAPQRP